jgi:hypothetical protein
MWKKKPVPLLLILVFRVGPADYSYMSVYYTTCNQLPLISMFVFVTSVCRVYGHVCMRYSCIETKEAARICVTSKHHIGIPYCG